MNNTTVIIDNLEQKVIDKDSFSIIKNIVKKMEIHENIMLKESRKNFKYVMDEIESLSIFIRHYEKKLMNKAKKAKKSITINKSYSSEIFELMKIEKEHELDDIDDIEWERLNEDEEYESHKYCENEYYHFTGWFCGASCDI